MSNNILIDWVGFLTESTEAMQVEKTNPTSAHVDLKISGLSLPRRSSRASDDSSIAGRCLPSPSPNLTFSRGPGVIGVEIPLSSVEALERVFS